MNRVGGREWIKGLLEDDLVSQAIELRRDDGAYGGIQMPRGHTTLRKAKQGAIIAVAGL